MPSVGFETIISACEQPQTYALDRAATGIGVSCMIMLKNYEHICIQIRGVSGKERYITCKPIGNFFMLIMATLPSTLILYL